MSTQETTVLGVLPKGLAAGLGVSTGALCDSCQPSWAVGGRGPPGGLVPAPAMLAIRRLWVCRLLPAPSAHKGLSPKCQLALRLGGGLERPRRCLGQRPVQGEAAQEICLCCEWVETQWLATRGCGLRWGPLTCFPAGEGVGRGAMTFAGRLGRSPHSWSLGPFVLRPAEL